MDIDPIYGFATVAAFAVIFFIYFLIRTVVRAEIRREMRYQAMTRPKPPRERNGRFKRQEA